MARLNERTKKAAVAMPAPHTKTDAIFLLVYGIISRLSGVLMSLLIWMVGSRKVVVDT